jgi:hypothetical protein
MVKKHSLDIHPPLLNCIERKTPTAWEEPSDGDFADKTEKPSLAALRSIRPK